MHHWVTCWRHHCHVSPNWRHQITPSCWRHHRELTVDFDFPIDRWLLTFSRVDFCSSGSPYLVFRVDSIFAYFASKWRIRIGFLLVAIIVTNNPTNVFAIFVNILTTILRLVIITKKQLYQFLLLLLLTLRVSNRWLSFLHSLSLLIALSPFPQMILKTSLPMSFVWLVMHLIPLLSQLYLVCLIPFGLWILLVAIIWHLTRPYFLNLNLHHTLLIFTQQMVPQCLVIT